MSQSIYMLNLIGKGLQWGFEVVVSAGKMLQFCSTSLEVNGAVGRLWCWASACWLEDQSKAWVPLWFIAAAFCMPLNVIALWAQSHHGFCKCSRETHGFLDSQAHLKWGWEKMGENKYISALIKSSLDCVVWVLWICPPLTGCMKGMKSLVVKIGVAVLQEKAVWFPGVFNDIKTDAAAPQLYKSFAIGDNKWSYIMRYRMDVLFKRGQVCNTMGQGHFSSLKLLAIESTLAESLEKNAWLLRPGRWKRNREQSYCMYG